MIYQGDTITFPPEPSAHTGESCFLTGVSKINPTGVTSTYTHLRFTIYFSTMISTSPHLQGDQWIVGLNSPYGTFQTFITTALFQLLQFFPSYLLLKLWPYNSLKLLTEICL